MINQLLKSRHQVLWGLGVILVGGITIGAIGQWRYQAELDDDQRCCTTEQMVRLFVRVQQAFFLENNRFASSFEELQPINTLNNHTLPPGHKEVYDDSIKTYPNYTVISSLAKDQQHYSYIGAAFVMSNPTLDEVFTETIVCVAKQPGRQPIIAPPIDSHTCGEGTINTRKP
jgi:Type IV pilin-like G and H, putative